jgi:serine protease AprX
MGFFGFKNKMDKTITPYIKINSKRKIPVIICFAGNEKLVKNKIISNNGKIKHEYINLNAFACELSPAAIDKLSELPEVSYVCFDHKASLCIRKAGDIQGVGYAKLFNLTGKGIGIGMIDTGVFLHPDLTTERHAVKFFTDLVNNYEKPYDDNGHGTFMCGCIASTGKLSEGLYRGIAPQANLSVIKAFDATGNGFLSDIIKGIDIILAIKESENIKILCLPFEMPCLDKLKINPLLLIIKKALEENIAIIAPSGNRGPMPYSIYCPGNINEVITVGGADATSNNIKEYKICNFSGRGPTIKGSPKPDIAAPCVSVTSLSADIYYQPGMRKSNDLKNPYTSMSGTSISCALICGFAALLLEKNPALQPPDIKSMLCLSTISIGESKYSQGTGFFIFDKLVK